MIKKIFNLLNDSWNKWGIYIKFMIPALIIGSLIGLYPGYKAFEFIWVDPRFCTACHVHDYASLAWEESSHYRKTTCHDCHHQPLSMYAIEMYLMVTHKPLFPKDLDHVPHVDKDLCGSCHLSYFKDFSTVSGPMSVSDIKKIPKVDKLYLHKIHLSKKTKLPKLFEFKLPEEYRGARKTYLPSLIEGKEEREITCSDCHGGPANRSHNFSAIDFSCIRCHKDIHEKEKPNIYGCRHCHFQDFLRPIYGNEVNKEFKKLNREH